MQTSWTPQCSVSEHGRGEWSLLHSPSPPIPGFFPALLRDMHIPPHTSTLTQGHPLGLAICMLAGRGIVRRVKSEKRPPIGLGSRLQEIPGSWVPGI